MDNPNPTSNIWTLPEYLAFITSFVTLMIMVWKQSSDWLKARRETKKLEAEERDVQASAADTISDAAITLVSPLNQRIRDLIDENNKLRKHNTILKKQIRTLGATPEPQPNGNGE